MRLKMVDTQKIESIFVKGPFWPMNSYIVLRKITQGESEANIKVISKPNRNQAKLFAEGLCEKRNIEFGGFITCDLMEKEPIR
jgi:hypothetical protein